MSYKSGDIVLCKVNFLDQEKSKKRPSIIIYAYGSHCILCPITSNLKRRGLFISQEQGLPLDSVIRADFLFTILKENIIKKYCTLNFQNRKKLYNLLNKKLKDLLF